jgi:hypothetical protein
VLLLDPNGRSRAAALHEKIAMRLGRGLDASRRAAMTKGEQAAAPEVPSMLTIVRLFMLLAGSDMTGDFVLPSFAVPDTATTRTQSIAFPKVYCKLLILYTSYQRRWRHGHLGRRAPVVSCWSDA